MTCGKFYSIHIGVVLALWCFAAASTPVEVTTRFGTLVGEAHEGVLSFKNIPYALAPVGPLRWSPPQLPAKWDAKRAATSFGAPCAQLDARKIGEAKRISGPGFDLFIDAPIRADASEDCLSLNIWAPSNSRRAPVMVFIYGGGGSADIPWWDGTHFARDGVVLVTFNYRNLTMGKFAHPLLTKEAPAHQPLSRYDVMDQLAALSWVRDNIAVFGGDPGNVTVFGQSAGGAAVLQLLTVPSATGLFHKAIVQSGNGWWTAASQSENERLGELLAARAGLSGPHVTLDELRALPPAAIPQIGHFAFDGRLMPENPTDAFAAGRVMDVPLMIGWNSFDGSSLRYPPAKVIADASDKVLAAYMTAGVSDEDMAYAMYTDMHVGAPARWIAKQTAAGAPTYLYHFSYVRQADRNRARGAAHGSEIPYVFDSWARAAPGVDLSKEEETLTRVVHSCWMAFARTSVPECEGAPAWPRYSSATDELMELNVPFTVRQQFRKAQLDAQEKDRPTVLARQRETLNKLLRGEW